MLDGHIDVADAFTLTAAEPNPRALRPHQKHEDSKRDKRCQTENMLHPFSVGTRRLSGGGERTLARPEGRTSRCQRPEVSRRASTMMPSEFTLNVQPALVTR